MRRIKSQIEEERILLVSLDEIDGIISRNIRIVFDVLIVLICLDVDELVVLRLPTPPHKLQPVNLLRSADGRTGREQALRRLSEFGAAASGARRA